MRTWRWTWPDSLLDLVGNTPLVRLGRVGRDLECDLLAKVELFNPGGSVKDRPAVAMIDAAERDGLLRPGGTIVEPTSGNTGVGLAIVAAQRGYRCIFVMSDKMSEEKIALLRAYGAEVVVCPTAVPPEHPASYYSVADRLTRETPGAFRPDQYSNPANPAEHERSTGPEIWRQTDGPRHALRRRRRHRRHHHRRRRAYLKAQNPDVQIVGADPEGSVYSGGTGRPYLVEGVGEDFWPTTYDPSVVDRIVEVSDAESFAAARRVTREEGLLIGGSCGTAVHAALVVGAELGPDAVVVVLLPDSGRGYLSKIFNDGWMTRYGFLRARGADRRRRARREGRRHPRPRGDHRRHADARRVRRACASSACRSWWSPPPPSCRSRRRRCRARCRSCRSWTRRSAIPRVLDEPGRRDHGAGAADARDRRDGDRRRSTGWSRAPRCSCSTAATRSACSPAPTCSRSWPTAHPS